MTFSLRSNTRIHASTTLLVTLGLLACSGTEPGEPIGDDMTSSGGFSATGGVSSSGGSLGTGGSGGGSTGGSGTGGEADPVGTGGIDPDPTGTGGEVGTGGSATGGSSGGFTPSTGAPRTLGYLGCSMSVNVAEGYAGLGGERLWPPIAQYNGQVVQNWANNNDPVWGAFENAANQYGTPTDVWVMLCIFDLKVTVEEAKQIVANVRTRAPNAKVYITGQPVYDNPDSCFLAGDGGPDKTDRIARETAADASLNLTYPGALGPLASGDSSDGCHTNPQGSAKLGEQFVEWFGE